MTVTCGGLSSTYRRFWRHPEVPGLLPSFMILMHQVVRASIPLMALAQSVSRERADIDQVCRQLSEFLPSHIEEERDHDIGILDDLEVIGISREDILDRIPPPMVASLVGAQYYWILHHHPVALLGYMILLEGNPPSEAHIRRLQEKSRLPTDFFRAYRLHGELDPTHVNTLNSFLDSLPLSESQGHLIWISASHTASALACCLADIERKRSIHANTAQLGVLSSRHDD